ncbi:signal peptidase I [Pullulanibacillus sp. KACC 23026]|uniref:signal peptidase I n=1 Tax=Pullulanibacillus sp. KACC 23026 TaxID=3028315 RepID=UPI0023B1D8E1|nr:signal peptidase I [Pullulanibacillus sp. KACC 23026]WEG11004.1 signal peptidase I [Pullulanibacillus sp. KACC 23026]
MEEKVSKKREFWSWVRALLIAILLAIIVRHFFLTNYVVDGISMMPNFQNNNRLIVNKMVYDFSSPHYGDVIIFHATPTEDYVKRVIGLPGDTIVYKNDQLYRNGKKISEPYLNQYKQKFEEENPGNYFTNNFSLQTEKSTNFVMRVPKGKLWVMGDNRSVSEDSRMIGFVSMSQVVGKVSLRYYPFNELSLY